MDTTGTFEMNSVLENEKMLTCLHKHHDVEDLFAFYMSKDRDFTMYSMGISDIDLNKWEILSSKMPVNRIKHVCIDVANGYTEFFVEFIKKFKDKNPNVLITAGNVVTADQTQELILNGADIVKVGIGPGSVCTTRIQTGVGYPQLSAVMECADAAHGLGGHIIADGGCNTPGDVSKAFGASADFVMLGGMLAGHEECHGETIVKDGTMYKSFYGMSSKKANDLYSGGLKDYKSPEGKEVMVPFKGPVIDTVQEILGGIRSTCTYVGADELRKLSKCTTFVKVSSTHNKIFN